MQAAKAAANRPFFTKKDPFIFGAQNDGEPFIFSVRIRMATSLPLKLPLNSIVVDFRNACLSRNLFV